jgi:hypothetical protein
VGKGKVEFIAELADQAEILLPRNVAIVSREPYGGVVRMEISGSKIKNDCSYQVIVTDEPLKRVIELKESPHQDA